MKNLVTFEELRRMARMMSLLLTVSGFIDIDIVK